MGQNRADIIKFMKRLGKSAEDMELRLAIKVGHDAASPRLASKQFVSLASEKMPGLSYAKMDALRKLARWAAVLKRDYNWNIPKILEEYNK